MNLISNYKFRKIVSYITIYLVFFLIGDIIFSNFVYKKELKHNCYNYSKNFFYLHKNCNAKEKWVRQVKSYKVLTDENGFRFSGKHNNNFNKIAAFFGDSFTYGMGLDYEKTFVGIINKKKDDYKILNLGVPGYSPSVFNYQLKKLIKNQIIPNKIFIVLDISDVFEEASEWRSDPLIPHPIQIKNENKNSNKADSFFKTIIKNNFKGSRLIAKSLNNFFRSLRLYSQNFKPKPIKPGNSGWGNFLYMNITNTDQNLWKPLGFKKSLDKITSNFKEIAKTSEQIKSDLYIVIYPWPDSLEYGQSKFNWENFASNLCTEISCKKLINFFPEFKKIKNSSKFWLTDLYIGGDLHITQFGQSIIAEKLILEAF